MRLKRKVWAIKKSGQLLVSIPRCCDLREGDYVFISDIDFAGSKVV